MKSATPTPLPTADTATTGRLVLVGVWLRVAAIGICSTAAGSVMLVRHDTGFSAPGALAFAALGALLAAFAARRVRSLLSPADAVAPKPVDGARAKGTSPLGTPALAER